MILCTPFKALSQGTSRPVNVSLLYPVSINRSYDDTAAINLNILFSRIGSVKGLNLAVGPTMVQHNMSGVNLSLLYSFTGADFDGVELTGGLNMHEGGTSGLSVAGLVNMTMGDFKGGQLTTLYNFTLGDFCGVQASAFFNIVAGDGGYLQFSSANMTGENFTGYQYGAAFNYVGHKMKGVQTSSINIAGEVHGLQLGVGNISFEMKGVQIGLSNVASVNTGLQLGLVNIVLEQYGMPIGLVNVDRDVDISLVLSGSNYTLASAGLKISSNQFFTIFELGFEHLDYDAELSGTAGWFYGYDFRLDDDVMVSPHLGFVYVTITELDKPDDFEYLAAYQFRLTGELKVNEWLGIIGGVGYTYDLDIRENATYTNGKVLFYGGISLF